MTGEGWLPEVTAVVVSYNSGQSLVDCVCSLDAAGIERIVIVDNASSDDSVDEAAQAVATVEVIATGVNLGYGGGVNAGVDAVQTAFALICNSDLVVRREAVESLLSRVAADERVALAAPMLVDEDGRERPSARAFPSIRRSALQAIVGVVRPSGRRAEAYRSANRELAAAGGPVDWVTGACLLTRVDAFRAIGGFDPGYFMYVEEVDLCWRLHQSGFAVVYAPEARVVHIGGASSSSNRASLIVAHHRSLWRFAERTTDGRDRLLLPLVAVGIACRCGVVLAVQAGQRILNARATRRSTEASAP